MNIPLKAVVLCVLTSILVSSAFLSVRSQVLDPDNEPFADSEFKFVRLFYQSNGGPGGGGRGRGGFGRRGGGWRTDWPEAEHHLLKGIRRLTNINASEQGHVLAVMDEELFDYPWLYAVEVGRWYFNVEEAERLRDYLLRGGFLVVDDFHGQYEWASFLDTMESVFPNRPVVEILDDDETLHVLYDLNKKIQIPGVFTIWSGQTHEKGGITPHWRGIYDDEGRLMVAINFNMDLGDAWEHADEPSYPEPMTALAYRFGINYIIYSMTH